MASSTPSLSDLYGFSSASACANAMSAVVRASRDGRVNSSVLRARQKFVCASSGFRRTRSAASFPVRVLSSSRTARPSASVSTSLLSPRRRASSRPESMSSSASKLSHLHVPDQMLIDPVIRVVHEAFLQLLQLVQEKHQHDRERQCDECRVE